MIILALLFAKLSTKTINYRKLNTLLQSSGKGTSAQVSKKIRHILIISQVAVATTLVFINISLFKNAVDTIDTPLGFNLDNIIYLDIYVSNAPPQEQISIEMAQLRKKILQLPQVESIASTSSPFGGIFNNAVTVVDTNENFTPETKLADHQYFQIIGQPLLEGDYFSEADVKDQNRVVIVNDVFAKHLAPQGSVIGMQFDYHDDYLSTVIGVVRGIKMPGQSSVPMRAYRIEESSTRMLIKLTPDQQISREQIVTLLNEISSSYSIFSLESLNESKQQRLFTQYTTAVTTTALALITLFLAGIGLYGILSYGTQMRRFEMGTRMAVGAKRHQLIGLIIKDNAWTIALGIASSVLVMLALFIAYKPELVAYTSFGLLATFVITVIAIALLSLFACYWPLRQYINQPAIHSLRGSD